LRIRLWTNRIEKVIIIGSLLVGVVVGSFVPNGRAFHRRFSVDKIDFNLPTDDIVSVRALNVTTGDASSFPPPTFVFERTDFVVEVSDVSGGRLHVNVTQDGDALRTEILLPGESDEIVLVHAAYRLRYAETDVVLWATDEDVLISHLGIRIRRRSREYHPVLMALQFVLGAYYGLIPVVNKVKRWGVRRNGSKGE
jgi:hypothetical protein